jgi:general secretion pathway protein G
MYCNDGKGRALGFTLIELLIVVAIIGVLSSVVLAALSGTREDAYEARSRAEFRTFRQAVALYREDKGSYPPDVSRGIPPGLEPYLSTGSWPDAPWPDSVYDWDVWKIGGDKVVQLSVRFC